MRRPKPKENSVTWTPKAFAARKCPDSWTNTRRATIDTAARIVKGVTSALRWLQGNGKKVSGVRCQVSGSGALTRALEDQDACRDTDVEGVEATREWDGRDLVAAFEDRRREALV